MHLPTFNGLDVCCWLLAWMVWRLHVAQERRIARWEKGEEVRPEN